MIFVCLIILEAGLRVCGIKQDHEPELFRREEELHEGVYKAGVSNIWQSLMFLDVFKEGDFC
jgi:hypothetical protein